MAGVDIVKRTVDRFAREVGFTRRGRTWYRRSPEIVALIDLQRSDYGPMYYVNIAFSVAEIDPRPYPPQHQCHVRKRLERLVGEDRDVRALLDLEAAIPDDEREAELLRLLRSDPVTLVLEQSHTVAGLAGLLAHGGPLQKTPVRAAAIAILGRGAARRDR